MTNGGVYICNFGGAGVGSFTSLVASYLIRIFEGRCVL